MTCRLGLNPCYNKVCDCDGPRAPPGARATTCPSCGYTYGTHADTCLAYIHGMLTRLYPLTYGKVGRLYMVTQKCDGDHGGPACTDPECWQRPNPVDPNRYTAMCSTCGAMERDGKIEHTKGCAEQSLMTENETPSETIDIIEQRSENVEHVSRVREFRRILESKHSEAQSKLDTATWELGQAQRKVQEFTRRRDFITSEIEAFDKRHVDSLPV